MGDGPIERNSYSVEFRIDTVSGLFCMNSCLETEALHAADHEEVTFRYKVNETSKTRHFYQSDTGQYIGEDTRITPDGNLTTLRYASCEVAPFSGFEPLR